MEDAVTIAVIFLGISSLVAVPIGVTLGLPLAAWLGGRWLGLQERHLELQKLEVAVRLREAQMIPPWVDRENPEALLAWAKADRELETLTVREAMSPTTKALTSH